ncbi:hypothetical protein [Fibrella aquatilis]|uniref:Right handed beta helix domain-containing protein n=1 Tax=Fibrella aquatilis TaxID=2817059 RepID=A0A939JZK0_9BACT|nr:hypothetical protein [Fibrella aquatilis]MBO0930265.1 hypothetical protein [Fibrella aquatilis]
MWISYAGQAQTTRYVSTTGSNANPASATSWANSTTDLQGAINASTAGDQVWVAKGTYYTTTTRNPTSSFSMKDGVGIYGGFVGTETSLSSRTLMVANASVLSGDIGVAGDADDNSYHVFMNVNTLTPTAILDGFVITGGNANQTVNDRGGGMLNNGIASPTIRNCTFRDNRASDSNGQGGAIATFTNLRLINCSFEGNTARFGGAVILQNVGAGNATTIVNCSFQTNSASDGGAIFSFGASLTVINGSFQRNSATSTGAAIASQNASANVASVALINSVLWNNGSTNTLSRLSGTFTVRNSLSEATTFSNGGISTGPGNLTATASPFISATRTNLLPCSPASNTGDLASYTALNGPATDLAGNPRLRNDGPPPGQIDMGAYETPPLARLYVNASAVGRATGLSWIDAFPSLQTALTYGCTTDLTEIWVAGGTYRPTTTTGPASRTISFSMREGLAIIGSFAGWESSLGERVLTYNNGMVNPTSILSGDIGAGNSNTDNSYHVIFNGSPLSNSAVLDGFRITGGNANAASGLDQNGAGMYNADKASPVLRNCLFNTNQAAGQGGGMLNLTLSSPILTACVFQSNTAISGEGGAICNQNGSNLRLTNCAFINNAAFYGGAIMNFNNTTTGTNCSFLGNTAPSGAAIYSNGGGNSRTNNLTNCIIWGGGDRALGHTGGATTNVSYSLFEPAVLSISGFVGGPGNLTTTASPFASATTPQLNGCTLGINAGSPTTTTALAGTLDLAGNPRFFGGRIDMGATEFQQVPTAPVSVQNGNWNNTATWLCGRIPLLTEPVGIRHAVTLPVGYTGKALRLTYGPNGQLIYTTNARLQTGQ